MNFCLKATGFCSEVLVINVSPDNSKAEFVSVQISSDALNFEKQEDGKCGIKQGSFAYANMYGWKETSTFKYMLSSSDYPMSLTFSEVGEWGGYNNEYWEGSNGTASTEVSCKAVEVQKFVKELVEAFYSFHKAQNEVANLTIKTIKSLRIEEIVGKESWEIVKTTSRRGTR